MQKIRVCNVVCDITSGGVESVLLNYFSQMDRERYELDLITYGVQSVVCAEKFRNLGFNIIQIPPKREGFLKSVIAMRDIIKIGKYDVVHTHLTEWNCIPMFLAWSAGVKKRISHSHMADFPTGWKQKLLFSAQRLLNKCFANQFCACGDAAACYLYGERMLQIGDVKILNNAIDVESFRRKLQTRLEVRKELGISEETFCVGHIGRFLKQKNHSFLLDIFNELLKIKPNSILLLLGTGDLEQSVKHKADLLGITHKIRFLGVRGDANKIYQAMDAFCLPSLFEGLPVVGIEAQAAGLHCVVSDKVSNKVKITPLVTFLSLNQSAEQWANSLLEKENVCKNDLIPNAFNIKYTTKMWEKLYS